MLTFLKWPNVSGLFSHISVINVTPVISMPGGVNVQKLSIRIYFTFNRHRAAVQLAFPPTVILLAEQGPCGGQEDLHQLRHPPNHTERAQRRLLANVRVRTLHQPLHFAGQIACHLGRCDRAQRAQRQAHDELGGTVQVTAGQTREKQNRSDSVNQGRP